MRTRLLSAGAGVVAGALAGIAAYAARQISGPTPARARETTFTFTPFETAADHELIRFSAADGVHCIAPDGTLLGRILLPARVSNLCFGGGPQRNRLFIGASHALYAVFLNRRGATWP